MELSFEIDVETLVVETRGDGLSASIDIDPSGRLLAVALGSWAGIIRAETWETAVPLAGVNARAKIHRNLRFVDGGRHVAALVRTATGNSLRLWSAGDGSEIDRIESGVGGVLAADPAGARLVLLNPINEQLSCLLWDVAERRLLRELTTPFLRDRVAAGFRDDGRAVAVVDAGENAALYATSHVWMLEADRNDIFELAAASAAAFVRGVNGDVSRLVGHVRASPAIINLRVLPRHETNTESIEDVRCVDGFTCASAGAAAFFPTNEPAILLRLSDRRALAFATPRAVMDARFSPDGRRLVCVGAAGLIRAWNVDLTDRRQYL